MEMSSTRNKKNGNKKKHNKAKKWIQQRDLVRYEKKSIKCFLYVEPSNVIHNGNENCYVYLNLCVTCPWGRAFILSLTHFFLRFYRGIMLYAYFTYSLVLTFHCFLMAGASSMPAFYVCIHSTIMNIKSNKLRSSNLSTMIITYRRLSWVRISLPFPG